jgi:uncharacterized iron-regulated membrane protein
LIITIPNAPPFSKFLITFDCFDTTMSRPRGANEFKKMIGVNTTIRRTFAAVHRWTAVILFVLLVPISLSGTALVFQDELDALFNPERYAVSGSEVLGPQAYFASAAAALGKDSQMISVRYPEGRGPLVVQARTQDKDNSAPPQIISVYLDPPTARVLDAQQFRTSFFGALHRFHENLTVPAYSGRAIVGWAGVGMLFLSLSGIYLWWPRNGVFVPGLRWRRAQHADANLHHLFGFWISLPLALLSLTGIYLAFPPQSRALMSSIAPLSPQAPRGSLATAPQQTTLTADSALTAANALVPQGRPAALFAPVMSRAVNTPLSWRVQFRTANDETVTVLVNDATGTAAAAPAPLAGDRAAQWIRWIHEGSRSGPVWRAIVALTGLVPALLGTTGILMWLRARRLRRLRDAPQAAASLRAAE